MTNRINYSGIVYSVGTMVRGEDFSGNNRRGVIVEYSKEGGWYAVRITATKTAMVKVESARIVKGR